MIGKIPDALYGKLIKAAMRRGLPLDDAQDVVSEVIVIVEANHDPDIASVTTYAYTVLRSKVSSWRHSKHRRVDPTPVDEMDLPTLSGLPSELLIGMEQAGIMQWELDIILGNVVVPNVIKKRTLGVVRGKMINGGLY